MKTLSLLLLSLFLSGCSFFSSNDSYFATDYQPYNGARLTIGTTGIAPAVAEQNISFTRISLEDIQSNNPVLENLDALFITADYFEEGSTTAYDRAYVESTVPVFFIESKKAHVPFTEEDLTYETTVNFPEEDAPYISGIYYSNPTDGFQSFGVHLNNVGTKDQKVKEAYTAVFKWIDELIHEDWRSS